VPLYVRCCCAKKLRVVLEQTQALITGVTQQIPPLTGHVIVITVQSGHSPTVDLETILWLPATQRAPAILLSQLRLILLDGHIDST
jgi:glyceraldehyde-3-phosphate dehydrogenase/erythrose-4-phosphate dehydrogenase